jgi:hypothetical protein
MKASLLFLLGLLAAEVAAQPAGPPRRAHHALAYDEVSEKVVLTAGSTPHDGGSRFEFFNDYWEFDGVRWIARPSSGDQVSGIGLAFDSKRRQLVSFGGYRGSSIGDVRVRDGDAWRSLDKHPEVAAAEPGFVYDISRGRFIAFGGSAGRGAAHGDTWEFDGTTWTKRSVAGPPSRQAHVMVYDSGRNRTVVFGGMGAAAAGANRPTMLGDTWEFDGQRWAELSGPGPGPRISAGATYDTKRGRLIVFGGMDSAGFKGDTWSYDGREWRKLSEEGPEPRAMGYLAYDRRRDRIVLFGGRRGWPDGDLGDTWEFDGVSWKKIE